MKEATFNNTREIVYIVDISVHYVMTILMQPNGLCMWVFIHARNFYIPIHFAKDSSYKQ